MKNAKNDKSGNIDYKKLKKGTVLYKGSKYTLKIGTEFHNRVIVGIIKNSTLPIKANDKKIVIKCKLCNRYNVMKTGNITTIILTGRKCMCTHLNTQNLHTDSTIYYLTSKNCIRKNDKYGDYKVIGFIKQKQYGNNIPYIKIQCVNCGVIRNIPPMYIISKIVNRCKTCNVAITSDVSRNCHWRKLLPINVYYIYTSYLELGLHDGVRVPHSFAKGHATLYGTSVDCVHTVYNRKIRTWNWLLDLIDDGITKQEILERFPNPTVHPHLYTTKLDKANSRILTLKKTIKDELNISDLLLERVESVMPEVLVPPYADIPYAELLALEEAKGNLLSAIITKNL